MVVFPIFSLPAQGEIVMAGRQRKPERAKFTGKRQLRREWGRWRIYSLSFYLYLNKNKKVRIIQLIWLGGRANFYCSKGLWNRPKAPPIPFSLSHAELLLWSNYCAYRSESIFLSPILLWKCISNLYRSWERCLE